MVALCAGDSIDEITAAKMGICKRGRPVVIGAQPEPEALSCLLKHADAHGADAIQAEEVAFFFLDLRCRAFF